MRVIYPTDLAQLPVVYTNHIGLAVTPNDVTLELCQLQYQGALAAHEAGDDSAPIDALARARVIMTHDHATRLVMALAQSLGIRRIDVPSESTNGGHDAAR